jgi:hypothetical protein
MSAEALLSRHDGVRKTGPGRWLMRCSVHEDRSPSVSVRELPDGRVLVHCFAGCSVEDILAAVGLDWSALFPVDWAGREFKKAPGIPARDVLEALEQESLIVAVIGYDMIRKREIGEKDFERLRLACQRIGAARSAANG